LSTAGLVAPQPSLHAPQRRHAGVQPRELLLDRCDDAVLLGEGWEGERIIRDLLKVHSWAVACVQVGSEGDEIPGIEEVLKILAI
jgi:hypothetical protein